MTIIIITRRCNLAAIREQPRANVTHVCNARTKRRKWRRMAKTREKTFDLSSRRAPAGIPDNYSLYPSLFLSLLLPRIISRKIFEKFYRGRAARVRLSFVIKRKKIKVY